MQPFDNRAQLGAFGEYVYQKMARLLGYELAKANILEHDFDIIDAKGHIVRMIDVKATGINKFRYNGVRVSNEISYDLVVIVNGEVVIRPDKDSPLLVHGQIQAGSLEILIKEWGDSKKSDNTKKLNNSRYTGYRIQLKNKLIDALMAHGYRKPRVVFRGSVSKTRWSSSPDNIPGGTKVVRAHDVTVFVQLLTKSETEDIEVIFVIPHCLLKSMPMKQPDKRQVKKGIAYVIDWVGFQDKCSSLVFNSIESMAQAENIGLNEVKIFNLERKD